MKLIAVNLKDGYKVDHRSQYPKGSQKVYTNATFRSSRDPRYKATVNFGLQGALKELQQTWQESFFSQPKDKVLARYKRRIDNYLGPGAISYDHIARLHDLGFLPVLVKALPEGTLVPIGVPPWTITNSDGFEDFFWLPNFLETILSSLTWKQSTNATIAFEYRKVLQAAAVETDPELVAGFVQWQGHDFSFRGMDGPESATRSGAAHLLSFTGTDTIPSIDYLEDYYNADCEKELIGGSVPATEHSVMCMGGQETEVQTFLRLLKDVYPTSAVLSVVSDTWDYWDTLTVKAAELKPVIMARPGKLVFRPDSGDPVKIICGDPEAPVGSPQYKGSIEVLWDTFGGSLTSRGYKRLDPHVGLIYGDSITLERAEQIMAGLKAKGFASTNVVLGIGSYTYQYNTRDTFGMALKATYGVINGVPVDMYKNPKTDNGVKKSAKGLLRVNEDFTLSQQVTPAEEKKGLLQPVYLNGKFLRDESLSEIRARLLANLNV
jgi:nicotinamide phosphoribosyltransferase